MTFRTPDEAVALANNTRYGLAASVWTENINRALEVAARIKAGVVWINSTNLFDAASGFGGYRESGFGREGGREGLAEYLGRAPRPSASREAAVASRLGAAPGGRRRRRRRSTARRSSTSAASRRGPTPATATRCSIPKAARSASPASATARTSATPSRRRARPRRGAPRPRTTARRCSITSPRISSARAGEFAERLARDDRRFRAAPRATRSRRRSGGCSSTPASPTNTTARCTRPEGVSSPWR